MLKKVQPWVIGVSIALLLAGVCTVGSVLFACIGFGWIFDWLEVQESFWPTYEEAVADGLIQRGWAPAFLPQSASQIRERHDIDTNECWIHFQFDQADFRAMVSGLKEVPASEVLFPRRVPSWWPSGLRKGLDLYDSSYRFYKCDFELKYASGRIEVIPAFLVVDGEAREAWYWMP